MTVARTEFPLGPFDVVLADPPWSYYGAQDKWGAAAKFYETLADERLRELPVGELLRPTGMMFLWATSPRLDLAVECIEAWGLHFRGVAFVWVKTTGAGVPIRAQGVRPSITKPTSEFVLVGSPVAKGRPMPLADEAVCQVVLAPRGVHSAKPIEVQQGIERLYPEARRLELFARQRRDGWEAWGDEVTPGPTDP
jgi:N6-adenosine-specific RNA methylase IME4